MASTSSTAWRASSLGLSGSRFTWSSAVSSWPGSKGFLFAQEAAEPAVWVKVNEPRNHHSDLRMDWNPQKPLVEEKPTHALTKGLAGWTLDWESYGIINSADQSCQALGIRLGSVGHQQLWKTPTDKASETPPCSACSAPQRHDEAGAPGSIGSWWGAMGTIHGLAMHEAPLLAMKYL